MSRAAGDPPVPTVRVRLDLGYDGTAFAGWARQPGQRTVEQVLLDALATAWRCPAEELRLVVAGRTDAGVHATGQVCHVDVPSDRLTGPAAGTTLARVRGLLPDDVRVRDLRPAPAGFDARFSAVSRRYEYRLCDAPGGVDPLRRHVVVPWRRRLDVDAMTSAAVGLLGVHDFLAFCRPRPGATTIRTVQQLTVDRHADDDVVLITVQADAFCHHMVRAIVGALVAVGDGRRPVGWPAQRLAQAERTSDITVMPAAGLTLVAVKYPADPELAARAVQARARRDDLTPDRT